MENNKEKTDVVIEDEPIHFSFGLSYSNFTKSKFDDDSCLTFSSGVFQNKCSFSVSLEKLMEFRNKVDKIYRERDKDSVGMILVSENTWNKVKCEFPPSVESAYPVVGFVYKIPICVSSLVEDNMIIPLPKSLVDKLNQINNMIADNTMKLWMKL
jgi:hypothetical protein